MLHPLIWFYVYLPMFITCLIIMMGVVILWVCGWKVAIMLFVGIFAAMYSLRGLVGR